MVALAWTPLPRALSEAAEQRLAMHPSLMVVSALLYLLQGRLWVGFSLIGSLAVPPYRLRLICWDSVTVE